MAVQVSLAARHDSPPGRRGRAAAAPRAVVEPAAVSESVLDHLRATVRRDERMRLRDELHDGVLPWLHALLLHVETLGSAGAGEAKAALPALLQLARGALDGARRCVAGSGREMSLADSVEAIATFCAAIDAAGTTRCRFLCRLAQPFPSERVAAHLPMIALEAVANALRHGRPRRVIVVLTSSASTLDLLVGDDGVGIQNEASTGTGVGPQSLMMRVRGLGGVVTIAARRRGVRVHASVPVGDRRPE